MELDLKWDNMACFGLILRQDGAIWLRIISKPLLTPKRDKKELKIRKKVNNLRKLAKFPSAASAACRTGTSPWACVPDTKYAGAVQRGTPTAAATSTATASRCHWLWLWLWGDLAPSGLRLKNRVFERHGL